jgi:hypothetical protein
MDESDVHNDGWLLLPCPGLARWWLLMTQHVVGTAQDFRDPTSVAVEGEQFAGDGGELRVGREGIWITPRGGMRRDGGRYTSGNLPPRATGWHRRIAGIHVLGLLRHRPMNCVPLIS